MIASPHRKLARRIGAAALTLAATALLASPAQAEIFYNQDVTNEVINGTGNDNGSFTVDRTDGVELGLRGKLRFNESNMAENTFNSNGDGSYTFQRGLPPTGFGWNPNSPTTPVWNFEWSINTNYDGSTNWNLDDLTYVLSLDFDPDPTGTNFRSFDPINEPVNDATWPHLDHAMGTNATGNGDGVSTTDRDDYEDNIAQYNLAQNSWNMEFFNDGAWENVFNANDLGVYDFVLSAYDGEATEANLVSSVTAQINVVPTPGATAAGLLMFGVLGMYRRPRRQAAA